MGCVNVGSKEFKDLVKGLNKRETFVAKAVLTKYLTDNNTDVLPGFIKFKSLMSDLYNTGKSGIDYENFYNEVKAMFAAALPNLSNAEIEQRVKFVDKLELMRLRGGLPVLSTFINNTVYISNSILEERGEKAYNDVRHEIFHIIFNNFLNEREQEEMFTSFKRWKPGFQNIMDKEELEEAMADTFEIYRFNKKSIPVLIKEFFEDILKFFGLISTEYRSIQKLFSDVEQGKFTRDFIKDSLVTRDKTILSKYTEFSTDLDLFLQTKAFVLNSLNDFMFPVDNEAISVATNPTLFLKQDYTSKLFQNNRDAFKLGLTKNDALKALQDKIKNLKNTPTLDPQMTRVIQVLSKKHIFKDMFDYLQPYSLAEVTSDGELVLKGQTEVDETIRLLEEQDGEEINSLEIGSKELINPTTKISEVVKDFLSSVTYETTPGNFVNIDPGAGFISLLNLLNSLYGNTSVQDNLESLKTNYNSLIKGNQTKAVYNKLKKLHEAVIGYNRLTLNIKGVEQAELTTIQNKLNEVGIKSEIFKDTMTIVIPDNITIENQGTNNVDNKVIFSFNRFKEGKESFLIEQKKNESNKTFIEKIANQTDIPSFIISKIFQYNEQRNQLAEITKVAGSLRKLSPKFVRVATAKITDPNTGETGMSTSYSFINKVNDYKSSTSLSSIMRDRLDVGAIRKQFVNQVNQYKDLKNKGNRNDIRNLLKSIVVNNLDIISQSDFEKISDKDVLNLMNNLERVVTFVPDINTNKLSEEFKDSDVYLRQTSNFSSMLNRYTFEKNNPTSFAVSTSNKSKWENVMSNTSWKIFKNLEDFAMNLIKADNLLPYLKNSFNNYLRYNPLLIHDKAGEMSVNENLLKVGEDDFYADHQETYFENKSSNYEKPPVPFSKETPRDWINRNFLAMFQLPILENLSNKKDYSYYQQKFQPESAPNVSVVKMGLNSAEGLQQNIKNMILQEAYMHHLGSNSNRGNILKNTKKSLLPGLEGSTYFLKNGENIFFDGAGNPLQVSDSLMNGLVNTIMASIDQGLEDFVNLAITEKATLDGSAIATMYSKIKNSYPKEYQLTDAELTTLKSVGIDAKTDVESFRSSEYFDNQFKALKKAMSVYYMNSYVNGFFMNQLSSGATQNYKNPLDEIKRQAGVNAMNDTGLIDNKHGMRSSYKNVVIAAANNFYGQSHKFAKIDVLKRFFLNKKQEVGDAQSWDLPEYKSMLRKSFGKSVDMGIITKDVHFEVNENGGSDYRKTSSAELTNEVVQKNKTLRDLRFAMTFRSYIDSLPQEQKMNAEARARELYDKLVDNNGLSNIDEHMEYQDLLKAADEFIIHKASFESAIKGSKPAIMSSFVKDSETGTFNFNFEPSSVLDLNSSFNGIQQAIRHRYIDSFISHFTQLTYLIGLNRTDTSVKNNKIITRTLSKFAKAGIFDTLFNYKMSYDQDKLLKVNLRSKKEFISDLKKKLDLPGNERLISLLSEKGVSMNNPLFSEKLMQSFFNSFTKNTVMPKHPGGSFVLQSEFGFEANRTLAENSLRIPELVTDEAGNILYAECYMPEMYSDQFKNNDLIYYNSDEYNKMFGFRIPSSDLHSSVPLKVIGYYPSSLHDNVVVIPSAVTALHGSDFDVDKLFVVRYGVFGVQDETKDPKDSNQTVEDTINKREYKTKFQSNNVVIAQKGIKFGHTAEAEYDSNNNIISLGEHKEVFAMESILVDEKEKTQDRIIELESEMYDYDQETRSLTLNRAEKAMRDKERRDRFFTPINDLNKHLKTLQTIQKGFYSNQILDAVLGNISYSGENKADILFGITFDPVKGYEEESEYSKLAEVYSAINKANGVEDTLAPRPKLYKSLDEADPVTVSKIRVELQDKLGVDTTTAEGQADLLALVNEDLKDTWVSDRDEFIRRQRGSGNVNINKPEQHVNVHKETYMASGLVGLIANFSKGLSYAFHGIIDDAKSIAIDLPQEDMVTIDGQTFDKLVLENKEGIKNQELRSLALNAAIDHVKEQILNVLNVGNNTAKIFLAAISTEMSMHQATMLMLQPVAKELNSSDATTIKDTITKMQGILIEKLGDRVPTTEEFAEFKINTKDIEKNINKSFLDIVNDTENSQYRKNLMTQLKVLSQLKTLNRIGEEVSSISGALSIIQGLPYNLEVAYDKLKTMDNFIDIEKFFDKLSYTEKSEYTQPGFKDDLKKVNTLFSNVNLANNENVLGALEAIKTQIDIVSEIFSENSIQAQFLVNNMIKAITNNSDPTTMFTGESDENLTFDTVKSMTTKEKYLKGKSNFNSFRMISRNIFNYLTSGLNMEYNRDGHIFSLAIKDQNLVTITKDDQSFQLSAVKSYLNAFLMNEGDSMTDTKNYDGDNYVVSQINPEWRIKPLSVIKKQNPNNRFLKNVGIDTNFRDKVRVMTFNNSLVNTAENLAEIEQGVNLLNGLNNIYVRLDNRGRWVNVPTSLHPETTEMNEVTFNILKASLYTDQFKFSSSKATNVIPPKYYQKIFQSLETLVKDLIYFNKNSEGNKFYKDFSDLENQSNERSALSDIKENLFINTIFSLPTVLPNLKSILPKSQDRFKHLNRQGGLMANGNIYDIYFDANILDKTEIQEDTKSVINPEKTYENTNMEVEQDLAETEAEKDIFNKFRKNPSFIADESFDRPGSFELFMKVGTTGSKETNDLKYFYKKIGSVNGKLTNNSFDLNTLLNRYSIKDYFNPKRLAIPVKDTDISQDKLTVTSKTSAFLISREDDLRTKNSNKAQVEEAERQMFEQLKAMPENKNMTDDQIKAKIKTKVNVQNVINQVNEVSLYDSRSIDRVGSRNFKIIDRKIQGDSVTFELEALPLNQQPRYTTFSTPLVLLNTLRTETLTREEKIERINSLPGANKVTSSQNLTDAQLDEALKEAIENENSKQIDKVLKNKNCK